MSFDGYCEYLCSTGHYWRVFIPCWDDLIDPVCPHCEASPRWSRIVDRTHGEDVEAPSPSPAITLVEPAETAICNLGHVHEIAPARYTLISS